MGLSLASRLGELWTSDAHHEEGLSRLVGLLASGAGSADARSEAAYTAGFIAEDLGDDDQAVALWEQALAEALAGGDSLGEARARRMLSLCDFDTWRHRRGSPAHRNGDTDLDREGQRCAPRLLHA